MSEHKEHKGMSGFFSKLRRKKKEGKLVDMFIEVLAVYRY